MRLSGIVGDAPEAQLSWLAKGVLPSHGHVVVKCTEAATWGGLFRSLRPIIRPVIGEIGGFVGAPYLRESIINSRIEVSWLGLECWW